MRPRLGGWMRTSRPRSRRSDRSASRSHLLSLATNALIFGGVYRFLSKGPVRWKLCFGTGLAVAGLWDLGRVVIANLIIGENYTTFGVVGSFLGILLWVFYNNLAVLLGAVVIRVLARNQGNGLTASGKA